MRHEAVIRIADEESDTIGRGVRQVCPISCLLLSIYAEVMIEALENVEGRNISRRPNCE